ncbi:hypothetical protein CFP56_004492, partial [Quercus suber]
KIGDELVKTKAIASTGVKKVKEGTAVGLHWIRDKGHGAKEADVKQIQTKLLVWVCAHVYCFGLVLDGVVLVIQRKMGGERVDQKIGDELVKTKAIASTGVKKVKEGTAVGLHWIRDKYQKN